MSLPPDARARSRSVTAIINELFDINVHSNIAATAHMNLELVAGNIAFGRRVAAPGGVQPAQLGQRVTHALHEKLQQHIQAGFAQAVIEYKLIINIGLSIFLIAISISESTNH